jgi:hypothetical protein
MIAYNRDDDGGGMLVQSVTPKMLPPVLSRFVGFGIAPAD